MEEGVFENTLGIRGITVTKKVSFVVLTLEFRLKGCQGVRGGLVSLFFPNNVFYVATLARRITHTRVRARCPMELDQNTAVFAFCLANLPW